MRSRFFGLSVGLFLSFTVAIGLAWGCVPQPIVEIRPASSGPAGSTVDISGLNFNPSKVEIRWNAMDGEVVGMAEGPSFSTKATVPKVAPGLYVMFLISREEGGAVGAAARTAFEVIPNGKAPAGSKAAVARSAEQSEPGFADSSIATMGAGGLLVATGFVLGLIYYRLSRTRANKHIAGRSQQGRGHAD